MTCYVEMVNCGTGEIYYQKQIGNAFTLDNPMDVGFNKVMDIVRNAVKGCRIKREPLQVRLMFHEVSGNYPTLPFKDLNEFETPYEVKPF